MAFLLSKKVSQVVPYSKRGKDHPPSSHKGKGKGNPRVVAALVAKSVGSRSGSIFSVTRRASMAKQQQQQQPQVRPRPRARSRVRRTSKQKQKQNQKQKHKHHALLAKEQTPTCDTMNSGMFMLSLPDLSKNSNSISISNTFSNSISNTSSDPASTGLLSLPDISKLSFPPHHDAAGPKNSNASNDPSSPGLLPRPLLPVLGSDEAKLNLYFASHPESYDSRNDTRDGDDNCGSRIDLPPVDFVCVPVDFVLSPLSPMAKTKGCLRGPPPRASEWDDTTIESQIRPSKEEDNDNCNDDVANNLDLEDSPAETTTRSSDESSPQKFSSVEQHQPQQRDEATTEATVPATVPATATTKHWIERAARHAERQRRRRSLAPRGKSFVSAAAAAPIRVRARPREGHHQRALLASLEQERAAKRASLLPPRTVKWHVVRDSSFVA